MEKRYIVKSFIEQTYYCGELHGWENILLLADSFDTVEDAENFIKREDGMFQIETVYKNQK